MSTWIPIDNQYFIEELDEDDEDRSSLLRYVNPETGEVIDIPPGPSQLQVMAARLLHADQQERIWKARRDRLAQIFIARQEEKAVVYPGAALVRISSRTIRKLDLDRFRVKLDKALLDHLEALEMVHAATGFDTKRLGKLDRLRKLVSDCIVESVSNSWVTVEPIAEEAHR